MRLSRGYSKPQSIHAQKRELHPLGVRDRAMRRSCPERRPVRRAERGQGGALALRRNPDGVEHHRRLPARTGGGTVTEREAAHAPQSHIVRPGKIKRLIHRYLEDRNKRRAFRHDSAENRIVALYEGRRWCDATELELIGDITNIHGVHL